MKEEVVILVDSEDKVLGTMPKLEAHEKGILHRAFSVFLFNSKKELLLQRRAENKYHSPGLWTNTCCSHQRLNESTIEAGNRRLMEEMGITSDLKKVFTFKYKTEFDNGLIEHELDHVLFGYSNDSPNINLVEVSAWKWLDIKSIENDIIVNPNLYTTWFKIIFDRFSDYIKKNESYSK